MFNLLDVSSRRYLYDSASALYQCDALLGLHCFMFGRGFMKSSGSWLRAILAIAVAGYGAVAVSYTHLTLPTMCVV